MGQKFAFTQLVIGSIAFKLFNLGLPGGEVVKGAFNLRLSRARTGVVAMRQDWIPRNWGEKGVKFKI